MRLFVAIHFSGEVKSLLADTIARLRRLDPYANFTRPENLHLTLAFIGESRNVAAATEAIQSCRRPAFEITVGGFGHFGQLYWVGIRKNPQLTHLAKTLQDRLREGGFNIERREFKPHITIARRVSLPSPVQMEIADTPMRVGRISLMKSERLNGRLTYTEVFGMDLE